ncbi:MAG: glycine cleavage system protein T [Gammaproteobacteria bacterium]|nr:glycine cleavage system protein T [Gammaproteobacteria bacterium]
MTTADDFGFGTQIRKSPYFDATVRWGARGFSVYNHMYIPRDFGNPEQNFWNLVNEVILCDVAVERQVEITGPDAAKFTQMLTPRDLSNLAVGQCKYVLITNAEGGILNDPVLLRLGENHFWISLADSDILLWAQGLAVSSGLDVQIREPDVSPLQLQGPNSAKVMQTLFGDSIMELRYYWLREVDLDGIPLVVSRTGWSSELGYELYLRDGSRGDELWEKIMSAGSDFGIKPGHTSTIRRIEAGMLSYHADMDINTNPFELGLERLLNLEIEADFVGKNALLEIRENGVSRKQVGLTIDCDPLEGSNTRFWPLDKQGESVGKVTSAVYSPRLEKNIALAMVSSSFADIGTKLTVQTPFKSVSATVVEKPFFDPGKKIVTAA